MSDQWLESALGYTLGSGKLLCDFSEFQQFAEDLLQRPILTHEFGNKKLWSELRAEFEARASEANVA